MLSMLIIDDEYLVRKGLQTTIDWPSLGIHIVDEASNGKQGFEMVKKYEPDILMTDIKMPLMDGLELMKEVHKTYPNTAIIVLSGFDEFNYAKKAMNYGAMAYLLKPLNNSDIIKTINKIVQELKVRKSKANYQHKLQKEITSIKRQFLLDLIFGDIQDQALIKEKSEFLQIPLDMSNQIIVSISIDHRKELYHSMSLTEQKNLNEEIELYINQNLLLSSHFYGILLSIKTFKWCVILQLSSKDNYETSRTIDAMCSSFFQHFDEDLYTFSIGISNRTHVITEIHDAYTKALSAGAHKLLHNKNSVTFYSNIYDNKYRKEITDAILYISNHYMDNLNSTIIAEKLHISNSHIMRLFKKELGITFNDYLTDYRMNVAMELLDKSLDKIYEISYKVGYTDVKYFSQLFKKNTGYTPREYRKRYD